MWKREREKDEERAVVVEEEGVKWKGGKGVSECGV